MSEISKPIQFGNKALKKLKLPLATSEGIDPASIEHYAIIGQSLGALIEGKSLSSNDYLKRTLPISIQFFQTNAGSNGPPPSPTDKPSALIWVEWLKTYPMIKDAIEKQSQSDHHLILRFFEALAKAQDAEALMKGADYFELPLIELRKHPPTPSNGYQNAVLAFAIPKSRGGHKVLFTVRLVKQTVEPFMGCLGPAPDPQMLFMTEVFFDANGEPIGTSFDASSLMDVAGQAWPNPALTTWAGFLYEIDNRCKQLFDAPLHELPKEVFGLSERGLTALIIDEDTIKPKGRWSKVFASLLENSPLPSPVSAALSNKRNPQNVRLATAPRQFFLGHMDTRHPDKAERSPTYPLDSTQRLACIYAAALDGNPENCILPINGPPGSGKTSFLRAVLASKWVKAALDKAESPPIVFGTGATNKSVSNIIEAFSDVPGLEKDTLTGRWIDGLPSYGWFYPSITAAQNSLNLMQLTRDKTNCNPFKPTAGADLFNTTTEKRRTTYLTRAKTVLRIQGANNLDVPDVLSVLHRRLTKLADEMQGEQTRFANGLEQFSASRHSIKRQPGRFKILKEEEKLLLEGKIANLAASEARYVSAINYGDLYVTEAQQLLIGWRSWLPRWFRKKRLSDLDELNHLCSNQFDLLGMSWTTVLPVLRQSLINLERARAEVIETKKGLEITLEDVKAELTTFKQTRDLRKASWENLYALLYKPETLLPGEPRNSLLLRRLCRGDAKQREAAKDLLWSRLDARHDLAFRVPLFHLSARYWEGRWIQEENKKVVLSNEQRLRQLMMLGVIVVATTHKLCGLGKLATADLLVLDEAGQCSVEAALASLSFTRSAVLVGDTKQLQPIVTYNQDFVDKIATSVGLAPEKIPAGLNPFRGSGMTMAQSASSVTDGGDSLGITLLYHYRCHPHIIGYCNSLLYGGRIIPVRPNKTTASKMPPMSWVDVEGVPEKSGSSWINKAELEEIANWVSAVHKGLTAAYGGKPLDEILAIITPLAAQARVATTIFQEKLEGVDKEVIERMIIGTVHRLQGAERPVIAFSLVQKSNAGSSSTLFADRDGGNLMNVAVSRAKDSFVIFGSRSTLKPAPSDEDIGTATACLPVQFLGQYLREYGTRLYPRHLVVVEALGKVSAIQKALGQQVAVLATNGYLLKSELLGYGELKWHHRDNTQSFLDSVSQHKGFLDSLVIATDDDIAGELIGTHVGELSSILLSNEDLTIRRMRFHSVVPDELESAFEQTGQGFDKNYVSAALLREYARHYDRIRFTRLMPDSPYIGAAQRDTVDLVDQFCQGQAARVCAEVHDGQGNVFTAYVSSGNSASDVCYAFGDVSEAQLFADYLLGQSLENPLRTTSYLVPELYPSSTTPRILAAVADNLGIPPWETQNHLNAMYQDGASPINFGTTYSRTPGAGILPRTWEEVKNRQSVAETELLAPRTRAAYDQGSFEERLGILQNARSELSVPVDNGSGFIDAMPSFPTIPSSEQIQRHSGRSAHPMLQPVDWKDSPEALKENMPEDRRLIYQIVWDSALACTVTSPVLQQDMVNYQIGSRPLAIVSVKPVQGMTGYWQFRQDFPGYESHTENSVPDSGVLKISKTWVDERASVPLGKIILAMQTKGIGTAGSISEILERTTTKGKVFLLSLSGSEISNQKSLSVSVSNYGCKQLESWREGGLLGFSEASTQVIHAVADGSIGHADALNQLFKLNIFDVDAAASYVGSAYAKWSSFRRSGEQVDLKKVEN